MSETSHYQDRADDKTDEREYTVTWSIEVTAENPREAARQVHDIMLDPQSTALIFDVQRWPSGGPVVEIDLEQDA